ncbi:MAG: SnoaL-like domain-containing protein [Pyrinomonadaceae bacterium]|nr:SnoaL-like domain-containing protein [Pyrinomonadaceae bacterium]
MLKPNTLWSVFCVSLVVIVTLTIASNYSAAIVSPDDEEAVMKVLMLEGESIEKGDLETLDKIWSHDESVLIFESGGADKGWKKYRDHHLAPELKAFKNTEFSITDAQVKVDGNTGWATYRYSLRADYKERKISSKGLGTMVFEKTEGKWLIVHSHTSVSRKPAS